MCLCVSKIKKSLLAILLLTGCLFSGFAQVTFRATAPNAVVLGEQFRLTYTVNDEGKDIRIAELPDFDILYGPSTSRSSSFSIVNGQTTSSISNSFTYTLMAKKEGSFEIPPATIKVGNSEYKSNSLTINILPQDKASGNNSGTSTQSQSGQSGSPSAGSGSITPDEVFVRMHVSKNSIYENEGFLVTFKIYSLYDLVNFENVKFPEFEGFVAQEIDLPANRQVNLENYNGRNYRTYVLKQTVLYPQRSGNISIPSGKVEVVLRMRSQQRVKSIFDIFDTYADVKKNLTINSGSVNVKPLPAGKPASFSGAVGDYKMTSSINSENVKANEAITVKISISGNGNIKLIKNPEITFPNDFEIYDPKIDLNLKTTSAGVSGNKSIEYLAIPRYAGDFTIPSTSFSYFDIKSGTYKTLSTPVYQLHVAKGEGNTTNPNQQAYTSYSGKEDLKFVGKDILYIKTTGFSFHKKDVFLFGKLSYLLWYIIPALLFIAYFIVNRKQAKENANIALVRTKKANKVASKRLKTADKLLKEDKREEFYDEILKALWGYLSDKLNIPVASLTKENVEAELTKYGVGESLIKEFMNILNTCEFARFAPGHSSHEMDKLYDATVGAIDKMENTIKK